MKVLFVFAHPDDECINAGGAIAKLSKDNEVVLLCATRGEAGEAGTPPICTKDELPKVRENELLNSANVLGISKVIFLDFIDALLKDSEKKLTEKVLQVFKEENPDIVVTFNDQGGWSKHPDHVAISKSVTDSFLQLAKQSQKKLKLYHTATPQVQLGQIKPIVFSFGEVMATPQYFITTTVNVSEFIDIKLKAFSMHKTQNADYEKLKDVIKNGKEEYFSLVFENSLVF